MSTTPASAEQFARATRLHQLLGTALTASLDVADELRRADVLPSLTRRSLARVVALVVHQLRQVHRMTEPDAIAQARLVDTLTTEDDSTEQLLTTDATQHQRLAQREAVIAQRAARRTAGRRG